MKTAFPSPTIGQQIKAELINQGISISDFARSINCSRPNVHDIMKRSSIDSELLMRISRVLHVNFFKRLSEQLDEEIAA
ncbi:MAG: helix-turn-helix domain-containing protein [Bacteroidaceae bacterium]|nr:helix-turn-helix domain-containing protein [Bacteroidaceae bacterium]